MIISFKEFIGDVVSSINFSSSVFPLNPGMRSTFPWLSGVAENFEEWLPRGIVLEYRTTSSDTLIAANPALGSVIICTQYNSLNPDFINKQQMENYEGAISCKPSVSMLHQVETKRSQTVMDEMYVRTLPITTGDLRLYDLGKTQVVTVGSQTNGNVIGELWISYEVELRKPKMPTDPIVDCAHFQLTAATLTGETPATPFGSTAVAPNITAPTSASTMTDARCIGGAANGVIFFGASARGAYLVTGRMVWGVGGTQGAWTFANFVNCAPLQGFNGNTNSAVQEVDAATASAMSNNFAILIGVTGANASFSITNTSTGTTMANNDIYITELPDNMN